MEKRKGKRPRRNRTAFAVTLLLVIGAFCFVWWIWPGLYNVSPQFDFLILEKNGERLKLLNGETLRLHPQDQIRILSVSTNVTLTTNVIKQQLGIELSEEEQRIEDACNRGNR